MKPFKLLPFLLISFLLTASCGSAFARINVLGKLKQKVEDRVEQEIDESADEALDEALESPEEPEASEEPEESEEPEAPARKDKANRPARKSAQAPAPDKPKLESYTQYDFVPGDRILLFEDFSEAAVGDFPARWNSNSGGEVKTVNIAEGKWFHLNGEDAVYGYSPAIALPENFIVEFDIIPDSEYTHGITLTLYQENPDQAKEINDDLYPGLRGLHLTVKKEGWETKGYDTDKDWLEGKASASPVALEAVNHVIVWIQNRRVRIYHRGAKALDVPTNLYAGTAFNRMRFSGWDADSYPMIGNLKITTAAPDTRSKLLTEGKIVSYGICFDSGKDVVKPESRGALKDIAAVLGENPDLKILVVGHTDSDGDDGRNLDLSKRRARSVKQALEKDFGIAPDRISTDGKGETAPLAPNGDAEGKARNRRVEFLKL